MMQEIFLINGKECRVTLDGLKLSWQVQGSSEGTFRVPFAEVISCWFCPKGSLKCCPLQKDTENRVKNEGQSFQGGFNSVDAASTSKLCSELSHEGNTSYESLSPCEVVDTMSLKISGNSIGVGCEDVRKMSFDLTRKNTAENFSNRTENQTGENFYDPDIEMKHDYLRGHQSRFTFKYCVHFGKRNGVTSGLSVEICERVLPSQGLKHCIKGDGEPMVKKWKSRVLVFHHRSADVVRSWHRALWSAVTGCPTRPRHLMVIVNPMSGKKNSETLYQKKVAPFFDRAAIRVSIRKTTHSGHAEVLATEAVTEGGVDGVVAVSGDGTVAEVITGLLKATATQQGVPFDDKDVAWPLVGVTLGVIAGGSANAYVISCHGTGDVVTAVLQIVMGRCRPVQAGGVYAKNKLVHVSALGIHAGFLAGALETSTKLRHLGPYRDIIACVKELFMNRSYQCEIDYLADSQERQLLSSEDQVCISSCPACAAPAGGADGGTKENCVQVKGEYEIVAAHLVRAECAYSKYGVSPMCHQNTGYCDVMLCPKTSRLGFLLRLYRIGITRDHLARPPVRAFRCREFGLRFSTAAPLNCDGELRYYDQIFFRVHRQCLSLYGLGREPISTLELSSLTNYFK